MVKVDVLVPCYNYGRFLEACVRSVLEQSLDDVRVLIIDDASSDDSLAVAERLSHADRRVSVISHPQNLGHITTYNQGIAWASSDYILLLSADDLLAPGALERAVAIMDANPDVVLTHGRCVVWHDDFPFPQIDLERDCSWARQDLIAEMCNTATNFVPTPTAIARTCTQKAIGGYRATLPHSGDMEMWLRFAAHGAVARINAVQAIYRKHSSAMSNLYFAAISDDYVQRKLAFDSFFSECGDLLESRSLRAQAYHALARQAFENGIGQLRRGQFSIGFQLIRWSLDLDPSLRYSPPLRGLLKIPGREGRKWALSVVRKAAGRGVGRTRQ
jgi:glycosyltransferase involved in cell wall biosynthesis